MQEFPAIKRGMWPRRRDRMIMPSAHQWVEGETLVEHFESRGVSRRDFLEFCGEMAVILGLGSAATPRIAEAFETVKRPSVIWLQLQECTGCVESVLRTESPTIGDLVLDEVYAALLADDVPLVVTD